MTHHAHLLAGAAGAVLALALPAAAMAQDDQRTPWGVPDFSGVYSEYSTAPLERDPALGEQEFWTEAEFAEIERVRTAPRDEPQYEGPESTGTEADVHYDFDAYALSANEGYSSPNRRTSIVTMPANGRIPPLLPAAVERRDARAAMRRGREYDGPEFRGLSERCVAYSSTVAPILPFGYNSNLQIYQSPGQVLIQGEMGDPRIVPVGDDLTLPEDPLPQWNGTSVGRWEGDTLVIETTGYHPDLAWRGATQNMRVTERISRIDHDTLEYEFTVEDKDTWAEPWGGVYPLTHMDEVLFEVACTEGNYGMANILSGARATEAEAE